MLGLRAYALAVALAFGFWPSLATAQVLVDTCGQVYRGDGFLAADLDCSGQAVDTVTIDGGGSLNLAGFTLSFGGYAGVRCNGGSCEVYSQPSGGEIVGGGVGVAVDGPPSQKATIHDVLLHDAGVCASGDKVYVYDSELRDCNYGIWASRIAILERSTISGSTSAAMSISSFTIVNIKRKITVIDSLISGNALAVDTDDLRRLRLSLVNSEIRGNGTGGVALSARLENSIVADNDSYGILALHRIKVLGGQISGNGIANPTGVGGLNANRVSVRDADISGNEAGIVADFSVKVRDTTVSNNAQNGITGAKVVVRNSMVTDNGGIGVLSRTYDQRFFAKARLKISESVVTGNGAFGAIGTGSAGTAQDCTDAGAVVVTGTDLTGNGVDLACGVTQPCASVASCDEPKLVDSSCETSYVVGSGLPGQSWSLCSLD